MSAETGEPGRPSRRRVPRPTPVIERNVRALVEHSAEEERARTRGDRIAVAISNFAGSMESVYFHVVFFGIWALGDMGLISWFPGFDTSFTILGTAASVEAIFLSTFVLIAQNRMAKQEDVRNHLALQASLLTEHEVTHVLRIVAAISDHLGLDAARNPELRDLLRDLAPKDMLEKIEAHTDAQ